MMWWDKIIGKAVRPEPPRALYTIRHNTEHRWDLIKAQWDESLREYVYQYPVPAAAHCVSREEAIVFMRSDITGKLDMRALRLAGEGWIGTREDFDIKGEKIE